MNPLDDRLWDAQGNVPPLTARVSFSDHKDTWLVFKKITNLVGTQIPHLSNFHNGIVPSDRGRGLDLG